MNRVNVIEGLNTSRCAIYPMRCSIKLIGIVIGLVCLSRFNKRVFDTYSSYGAPYKFNSTCFLEHSAYGCLELSRMSRMFKKPVWTCRIAWSYSIIEDISYQSVKLDPIRSFHLNYVFISTLSSSSCDN
jgi:hypothetical protein